LSALGEVDAHLNQPKEEERGVGRRKGKGEDGGAGVRPADEVDTGGSVGAADCWLRRSGAAAGGGVCLDWGEARRGGIEQNPSIEREPVNLGNVNPRKT
jgi:hypothetical protein